LTHFIQKKKKYSNNRLNERSANANNQNRLFDSQNNAAGGYCWVKKNKKKINISI
jgi:hypothetical protein